jgi:hypothetical protein
MARQLLILVREPDECCQRFDACDDLFALQGLDAALLVIGRHVSRHRREHALVEQRHPALDPALANEGPPLHVAAERRQIRVADPIADGGRLRGDVVAGIELPGQAFEVFGVEARGLVARAQNFVGFASRAPLVRHEPARESGL